MSEKFHMVPVPESALPEVYALLAQHTARSEGKSPSSNEVFVSESAVRVDGTVWSADDIRELARLVKNVAGRAVMTCIAQKSLKGDQASYEDLRAAAEEAAGEAFEYSHLRAQLSWLSKYSKKVKGAKVWPIHVETSADDAPRGERHSYSMPTLLAETWLSEV